MTDQTYQIKQQFVAKYLTKYHADALLLISGVNREWMTNLGPIVEDGFILITKKTTYLIVDKRDIDYCKKNANKHIQLVIWESENPLKSLIKKLNIKCLLVEHDYMTLEQYDKYVQPLHIKAIPVPTMILRSIKTPEEVKLLKQSANIAVNAIKDVRKWIHPGVSELETKQHIHQFMINAGARGDSFDLIIGFDKHTANPHHQSDKTILKNNQLVTCDIGCIYQGYCSDITRTFFVGNRPNKDIVDMFNLVKKAQALGLKSAKVGIKGDKLDQIVRDYIAKNPRWGKMFKHGLGHGVGLEIHECPSCRPTYHDIIPEYACITIEPGVYESNYAGVRIEDSIIVTKKGIINLTAKANKNFYQ